MLRILLLLGIRFLDVAPEAGLDFRHHSGSPEKKYILETIGGGVAWIDYDRDGWPDLYLVNGGKWDELLAGTRSVYNALYRNNGDGTFTDVTAGSGLTSPHWGMGAAVGDVDNDGWPDLYLCNFGPNSLYRNNGDGTFSDITAASGVGNPRWSSSAAFSDYDGDGWIDLYVANYVAFDPHSPRPPECGYRGITVHCGPMEMAAAPDTLYRNRGDGTFAEVTGEAGVAPPPAYGLGAVWGDYDNDGDPDLYVANDSMANFLFQNRESGRFIEVAALGGVAYNQDGREQAGMGVTFGDYDRDGFLDLYVTNFSDDYHTLYRNRRGRLFRDVTYAAEVAFPSWQFLGWGAHFADLDNDGWLDLFVSNGHIYPQVDGYETGTRFAQRKLVFQNQGNGKFRETAGEWGEDLSRTWSSRGAAFADFDNDGDLDVAVNNLDARPSLFRNEGAANTGHWLNLALEGGPSNRSAIGARVILQTESWSQLQEVQGGSSYQATNDFRLHFGLRKLTEAKQLIVRWRSGTVQKFEGVAADRHYRLKEGGELEPLPLKGRELRGRKDSSRADGGAAGPAQ